jgi:hypothetical protein
MIYKLQVEETCKIEWSPLSRLISLLLKQRPGIRLHFFSQKMAQKDPEKKIPLMAANAIMGSARLAVVALHHQRAHCALCCMQGTVLIEWSRCVFFPMSLTYVSISNEYVLLCIFLTAI